MLDQNWGEPNTPYFQRQEKLWNLWMEQKPETVKRIEVHKYFVVPSARMLIDLAAAGQLDNLLRLGCVVVVPDVVRIELVRIGDREVLQWIREQRDDALRLGSTMEWANFIASNATIKLSERRAVMEIVERLLGQGEVVEIL